MQSSASVDGLPPFDPPYELGGRAWALVGLLRGDHAAEPPPGFRVLRIFGRSLAIVVASDFTHPPPEMPVQYRELVVARLVRRGLGLAVEPLDMLLDHELPVELGHLHYGMPKRFVPSLSMSLAERSPHVRAPSLEILAETRGGAAQLALAPLRLLFALGSAAITRALCVLGLRTPGVMIRAKVALCPRELGRATRVRTLRLPGLQFSALWSQLFESAETHLGAPHIEPLPSERSKS